MHFSGDLRTTQVKYGWCNPTLVILAQLTLSRPPNPMICFLEGQRPFKMFIFMGYLDPYLITGSLGSYKYTPQTSSWLVQEFLRDSSVRLAH